MLVFESPSQSNIYFGRLMNIQTGEVIELPQGKDEHVFNLQVSVDGKWLAYEKGKGYFPPPDFQIIISGADGRTQITVDSEPSWSGFEGWLGENLLIEQRGEDHETLIVFNPFTGQKQSFFAGDYPQIYDAFPLIYGGFQPPLVVNPSLSLLVYPGYRDNGSGAILWDITMNQEITLLPTYGVQSKPEWSPDGIQVAIAKALTDTTGDIPGDQELFSLDRNGAPNRLTFLTEYYDRVEFGQFSWSPDGRYIAFGLVAEPFQSPDLYPQDNPEEFARLAVLDTQTHIVTNYCIPMYYGWKTPIWSPDSRQILVEDITLAGKSRVYLVDPPQGFAARIAEDVSPKGWMVSLEK